MNDKLDIDEIENRIKAREPLDSTEVNGLREKLRSHVPSRGDLAAIAAIVTAVVALLKPQPDGTDEAIKKAEQAAMQCEMSVKAATTRLEVDAKVTADWHSRFRTEMDVRAEEQRRLLFMTEQAVRQVPK